VGDNLAILHCLQKGGNTLPAAVVAAKDEVNAGPIAGVIWSAKVGEGGKIEANALAGRLGAEVGELESRELILVNRIFGGKRRVHRHGLRRASDDLVGARVVARRWTVEIAGDEHRLVRPRGFVPGADEDQRRADAPLHVGHVVEVGVQKREVGSRSGREF
jgi:hypothetical protein